MGTVFPDSPEFPDHRPLPTSFLTAKQEVACVGLTVGMYALCPKNEERHEHPPHEDHEPSFLVSDLGAGVSSTDGNGSASRDPMTCGNNSVFEANNRIISQRVVAERPQADRRLVVDVVGRRPLLVIVR
jgi:hypothetical protein